MNNEEILIQMIKLLNCLMDKGQIMSEEENKLKQILILTIGTGLLKEQ